MPTPYLRFLTQIMTSLSLKESFFIRLRYSNLIGPAQGMFADGKIVLREDLTPGEEFSVLAHELAHAILHGQADRPDDKTVRECEAEAVAFLVCYAVRLDARNSAADYIQLYQGDKDTLLASLGRIRHAAAEIIEGITEPECSQPEVNQVRAELTQATAA